MDISKYAALFHDGSLIEIEHKNNNIELLMASAEINGSDLKDSIALSEDQRIVGKLHLEKVQSIKIGDNLSTETLKKTYDDGEIVNFNIIDNTVRLAIQWDNYPPRPEVTFFSVITIVAKKIYWENIPNLEDSY